MPVFIWYLASMSPLCNANQIIKFQRQSTRQSIIQGQGKNFILSLIFIDKDSKGNNIIPFDNSSVKPYFWSVLFSRCIPLGFKTTDSETQGSTLWNPIGGEYFQRKDNFYIFLIMIQVKVGYISLTWKIMQLFSYYV